jgi:hypothetical protein
MVGIIANPASGTDIRRLVAYGSVFNNQEKVRIVRRILLGLRSAGVRQVFYMPDYYGIVQRALAPLTVDMEVAALVFDAKADQSDSMCAAELLAEKGAGCIITLGGDGTNRMVAKGTNAVPILPVSTGTNNVFPYMIEGTIAGLAAGLIATGKVHRRDGTLVSTRLEVIVDGELADMAIVDAVVCDDSFIGSRAVWKMEKIRQVFLNRCSPVNIGFSAIGGMQQEIAPDDPFSMVIEIGPKGQCLTAPVAPGIFETVMVEDARLITPDEEVALLCAPCVVALDGEREVEVKKGERATIRLDINGPVVVDIDRTMRWAMQNSVLAPEYEPNPLTISHRWNN